MLDPVVWRTRPKDLAIPDGEIHVWRAALDVEPFVLARLRSSLAKDEESRAARFHFDRDRNLFIASRGILRALLGSYLNVSSDAIEFSYGTYGKPALRPTGSQTSLRFNISHADGLAVLAFARDREIGVDLEPIRPASDIEEVAGRFFSAREVAGLRALRPEERAEAFYLCWTRKEAYVKARGSGLTVGLDSFSVSLTADPPETLQSEDTSRWTLHSFRPAPNFVAAIAGEGTEYKLRYWDWTF